jgi:hypothetical protein
MSNTSQYYPVKLPRIPENIIFLKMFLRAPGRTNTSFMEMTPTYEIINTITTYQNKMKQLF